MNQFPYFIVIIHVPQHGSLSNQSDFRSLSRNLLFNWLCHFLDDFLQFLDGVRRVFSMQHIVTVGTDWHQVGIYVQLIFLTYSGDWCQMMYMYEPLPHLSVCCLEVTSADQTLIAFLRHTFPTGFLVALILVGFHCNQCTLIELFVILWIVHIIDIIIDRLMGMQQEIKQI